MAHNRIVVGLDGSPSSQRALDWAVSEADRRGATILVVTACPPPPGPARDASAELMAMLLNAARTQRRGISEARAAVHPHRPVVIGREVIVAEPVTALCHAGAIADLIVIGGHEVVGVPQTKIAGRIAARLAERRHGECPLVIIPSTEPVRETATTALAVNTA
jgi:nucleotide-binding universal stress UspA family protein